MSPMQKLTSFEPAKRAFSLFEEFKNFAFKGNVVDLAIGVIIGAAFGSIVKSLVDNIIMPLVGLFLPAKESYEKWQVMIHGKSIPYGKFIADVVNFLIVAFVLYLFIVKFLRLDHEEQKRSTSAASNQRPRVVNGDSRSPQSRPTRQRTPLAVSVRKASLVLSP